MVEYITMSYRWNQLSAAKRMSRQLYKGVVMSNRDYKVLSLSIVFGFMTLIGPQAARGGTDVLVPGVVLSEDQTKVFVMSPNDQVTAVEVQSGRIAWTSDEAAKPLLVDGPRLYAQVPVADGSRLSLVALDTRTGSRQEAMLVDLPQDVRIGIEDSLASKTEVWAQIVEGDLRLGWEVRTQRVSPLPPEEDEAAMPTLFGAVQVNLAAGSVAASSTVPNRPSSSQISDPGPAGLQSLGVRQGQLVATTSGPTRYERAVEGALLQMRSADGQHILVSRKNDGDLLSAYEYGVFSVADGRQVGTALGRTSNVPFVVSGRVMVHVTSPFSHRVGESVIRSERMLRGVDLQSGQVLWEVPVRDLRYRGPRPR